jgi:WD40 repeat protein
VKLKFAPEHITFLDKPGTFNSLLAITSGPSVYLLKPETSTEPFKHLKDLHFSPISCISYVPSLHLCLSTDVSGLTELWDPLTFELPEDVLGFDLISSTDLMFLPKSKTHAIAVAVKDTTVAMLCKDRQIRIFDMKSGKLIR